MENVSEFPPAIWPVPECHAECLEACDVPRQFEYPQDPHDTKYLRYPPHLKLAERLSVSRSSHHYDGEWGGREAGSFLTWDGDEVEEERDEVRQDTQQVYDVHCSLHESK